MEATLRGFRRKPSKIAEEGPFAESYVHTGPTSTPRSGQRLFWRGTSSRQSWGESLPERRRAFLAQVTDDELATGAAIARTALARYARADSARLALITHAFVIAWFVRHALGASGRVGSGSTSAAPRSP
jgi:hypothetical protein